MNLWSVIIASLANKWVNCTVNKLINDSYAQFLMADRADTDYFRKYQMNFNEIFPSCYLGQNDSICEFSGNVMH